MDLANPQRRRRLDLVAAEYVLGTLPPTARRRLAAVAAGDRVVRAAIGAWENRLSGLADAVPDVAPSPQLWRAITSRLGWERDTPAVAGGWWSRLALWRTLAIASFAGLVALGIVQFFGERAPSGAIIAVLGGSDGKPVMIATANRGERLLRVKAVGPIALPSSRSLELWKLPNAGPPISMGLVDPNGTVTLSLDVAGERYLADAKGLAVTEEPAGGSPTGKPTGPVRYSGQIETL